MAKIATSDETLGAAFRRLVLDDPLIRSLLAEIEADPSAWDGEPLYAPGWPREKIRSLLQGSYLDQHLLWHVDAGEYLRDCALGKNPYCWKATTNNAKRALGIVADRVEKLIAPLRSGSITAHGHLRDGQLVEISPGIWNDRYTSMDLSRNSVGRFESPDEGDGLAFVPQWFGVVLTDHVRERPTGNNRGILAAKMAYGALWPNGEAPGLSQKALLQRVNKWLVEREKQQISLSTLKRFRAAHCS